ncbi:MAG: ComEC/Rec2 family competence protein [Candidatus Omnitrophota bacterium]|nr:MAG: ComEC/Rec2 family competence protein [Candidatus Omnitrophota bacterium]
MREKLAGYLNFYLFITFSLGIILGSRLPSFIPLFLLCLIALFLAHRFYRKNKLFLSDVFVLLSFFFLGAVWIVPHFYHKVDTFLGEQNPVTLTVTSLPQEANFKNVFSAKVKTIHSVPISFKVKVFDYTKTMKYLHSYRLRTTLRKRIYHGRSFYRLWVKAYTPIEELPQTLWDRYRARCVYFFLGVFEKNVTDEAYRFLASVFLGRRELLGLQKNAFLRAGASHLLAISGLHIGLTSLSLFFLLRFFHIHFKMSLIFTMIFLCLYTFLTGASPPTQRAVIMYTIFVLSFFVKRKINPLNTLGVAGLISLLINPSSIYGVGFQLSFLSVFAIILGFRILPLKTPRNVIVRYVHYIFFSSLFVVLIISPLVSYYFGKIYTLSIFYNVILIPFFALILMVNFLLIIFSPLLFCARSIGMILSVLIRIFNRCMSVLGSVQFSTFSVHLSQEAIFAYYLVLGIALILFTKKWSKTGKTQKVPK